MGEGDHACVLHRSREERAAAARAYARHTLASGSRLVYIAAERSPREVLDELAGAGIDVRGLTASGQLDVRDAGEAYLAAGGFDPAALVELLRAAVDAAVADGWSGLGVAGEMSWATDAGVPLDALVEYERRVDAVFRDGGSSAVCLYDSRRFGGDGSDAVAHVHPLVLFEPGQGPELGWALACIERTPGGALAVAGEVDVTNAASLAASLRAEAARAGAIRLDLRGLSFIDASGLGELREVGRELARRGGRVELTGVPRLARTAIRLVGLDEEPWLAWEAA